MGRLLSSVKQNIIPPYDDPGGRAVGRHAHMPPLLAPVDRKPGGSGSPVRRGVGTPPYEKPGGWAVGRHAHMPPLLAPVDRKPGNSGNPVRRGVGTPPYGQSAGVFPCGYG